MSLLLLLAPQPARLDPNWCSPFITLSNGYKTASDAVVYAGIGVAIDIDAGKVWFYNPFNGKWNNGALSAQDPVAGVGGLTIPTSGALYPGWSCNGTNDNKVTANFGASTWLLRGSLPAGFSAWGSSTTWDPSNKGANVTLSNGNLTAVNGTGSWQTTRGTTSHSSGKYYFELEVVLATTGAPNGWIGGLCTSSQSLSNYLGSTPANGFGYQTNGFVNGVTGTPNIGTFTTASGVAAGTWRVVLANFGRSSGKYYFEFVQTAWDSSVSSSMVGGFANRSQLLGSEYLGQTSAKTSIGRQYRSGLAGAVGDMFYDASFSQWDPIPLNAVVGCAIDLDANKVWFYNSNTSKWNNDVIGNQDPAAGLGGTSITITEPIYPAIALGNITGLDVVTVRFLASEFTLAVPSGFTAWDEAPGFTRVTQEYVETIHSGDPADQKVRATQVYTETIHSGDPADQKVRSTQEYVEVIHTANPADQFVRLTQQYVEVIHSLDVGISPSLVTDADTIYAPTIEAAAGVVDLQPGLITDIDAFYSPTIASLDQFLTPALYADEDAFYAPTFALQNALLPLHIARDDMFHSPTVASSNQLQPGLVDADDAFYAPLVAPVQELQPGLVVDGDAFYSPTVVVLAGVQPGHVAHDDAFHAPTISRALQPELVPADDVFYAPSSGITQDLFPGLVADADTFYPPELTQSAAAFFLPADDQFHGAVVVSTYALFEDPRFIDNDVIYTPSVAVGYSLLPPHVTDFFEQIIVPQVGRVLQPGLVVDLDVIYAPTCAGGAISVFPPFLDFESVLYVPTVQREKKQPGGGGGGGGGVPANLKYATSFVMAESGLITAVGCISERAQIINTRMMIYANSGGNPGALAARSAVKTTSVLGDNTYPLLVPYAVTAGQTIWIALHSDGDFKWLLQNVPGGSRFNNDTFADGPSDPFGAISIDNRQAPVFAILLEAVNATITVPKLNADDAFMAPMISATANMSPSFLGDFEQIWIPTTVTFGNDGAPPALVDEDTIPPANIVSTYALLPGLVIDSDIILPPAVGTISPPDHQVFSALMPADDVFYTATVTPLGAASDAGHVDDQDNIYPPDVTNSVELFPEFIEFEEIYSPTVEATNEMAAGHYTDQDFIEPPVIELFGADKIVEPGHVVDDDVFYPPLLELASMVRKVNLLGSRDSGADIFGRRTSATVTEE